MDEERHAQVLRLCPDWMKLRVGKPNTRDAAPDGRTFQTVFLHPLLELLYRQVGILQRQRREGGKAIGIFRAEFRKSFILNADHFRREIALGAIPGGIDAEHLHIDALLVHLSDAPLPGLVDARPDGIGLESQQCLRLGNDAMRMHVYYFRTAASDHDFAALARRLRLRPRRSRPEQAAS